MAATVVLPIFIWWSQALNQSLESDILLERFSFQFLSELTHYDRTAVWSMLGAMLAGFVGLTLLADTILVGGILQVLTHHQGNFLERFFSGGGRFFLRFVRLLLLGGIPALLLAGLLSSSLRRFFEFVSRDRPSEVLPLVSVIASGAAISLVLIFLKLILDYSRIRVALQDRHDTSRQLWSSLRFVVRHLGGTTAILIGVGLTALLLYGIYSIVRSILPASNWTGILVMILLQQFVMITRSGLRVALLASELEYYRSREPLSAKPEWPAN
jgi:hypothetical protein